MMEMDPILLGEILAGTLFFGIIFVLALGFPVAYTLAGTSLMVAAVGWYFEVFDFSNFGALASRYVGFMSSEVLVAVPLLVESGHWQQRVDRVLVVDCPEDIQVARVMARSGLAEAQVRAIMASQASREQRLAVADDVIDNGGSLEETAAQVAALHQRYLVLGV